jgi:hypothetical protein
MTPSNAKDDALSGATVDQVERANAAVAVNLNADGSPVYDSAQGYACALTAIIQSDARNAKDDAVEAVARALREADDGFCYSIRLTRLVDGDETHTLTIDGKQYEFGSNETANNYVTQRRNEERAKRVIAAIEAMRAALSTDNAGDEVTGG